MSFSAEIMGNEGYQFEHTTTKKRALGTVMKFEDGRQFVYARAGAVALAVGRLMQQAVKVSGHEVDMVTAAAAVGATTVTVTPITNNVTANQYAEGFLHINDEAGEGYTYKVKSHPAITATSTGVITLQEDTSVQVALTSATQSGLRKHPCDGVIVAPIAETGVLVGAAVRVVDIDAYCWLQKKGPCAMLTNGVVVVGEGITRSVTTAGAIDPYNEDGSENLLPIGDVLTVGATTEFSLVDLNIK